mgnify:CR=1 FL=1
MEDLKWLLRKCGLLILLLLIFVIVGGNLLGEKCMKKNKRWQKKYGSHL